MYLKETFIPLVFFAALICVGLRLESTAGFRPPSARQSRSQGLVEEARARLKANDPDGAIRSLTQALNLSPENFDASLLLGRIHLDANRSNEALVHLQKSVRLRPGDSAATFYLARAQLETGRTSEAFELLSRLVAREPGETANKAYMFRAALRLKKADTAQRMLAELRGQAAQNGPLHAQLAEWCFDEAPPDMAAEQIRYTLQLQPPRSREARLRYFLADLLHRSGRDADAMAELSRVLALDDSREEYFSTLLNLQSASTIENADRDLLQRGLKRFPDSKDLLVIDALQKIQTNQAAQASQIIDHLQRRYPQDSALHVLKGGLELNNMEFEKAAGTFRRALELRPENPSALHHLGICYRRLGKDVEALAQFEKAVALNPDYSDAWLEYGRLLHEFDRQENAAEALAQTIRLAPSRPAAYRLMAQVQLRLGKPDEASRYLAKFKQLSLQK